MHKNPTEVSYPFCFIGIADFILTQDGPKIIELGSLHTSNFSAINTLHRENEQSTVFQRVFHYLSQAYDDVRITPGPAPSQRTLRDFYLHNLSWEMAKSGEEELIEFASLFPHTTVHDQPLKDTTAANTFIFVSPLDDSALGQSVQKGMMLQNAASRSANITVEPNFSTAELMGQNKGLFCLIAQRSQSTVTPASLCVQLGYYSSAAIENFLNKNPQEEFIVKPLHENLGIGVFVIKRNKLNEAILALAMRNFDAFSRALADTCDAKQIEQLKASWGEILQNMPFCLIQVYCHSLPIQAANQNWITANKGRLVYIYHRNQLIPLDLYFTINKPKHFTPGFNQGNCIVGGQAGRNYGDFLHLPTAEEAEKIHSKLLPALQSIIKQAEGFDLQSEIIAAYAATEKEGYEHVTFLLHIGYRSSLGYIKPELVDILKQLLASPRQRASVCHFVINQVQKYCFYNHEAGKYDEGYDRLFELLIYNPYVLTEFCRRFPIAEFKKEYEKIRELIKNEKLLKLLEKLMHSYNQPLPEFWSSTAANTEEVKSTVPLNESSSTKSTFS